MIIWSVINARVELFDFFWVPNLSAKLTGLCTQPKFLKAVWVETELEGDLQVHTLPALQADREEIDSLVNES